MIDQNIITSEMIFGPPIHSPFSGLASEPDFQMLDRLTSKFKYHNTGSSEMRKDVTITVNFLEYDYVRTQIG